MEEYTFPDIACEQLPRFELRSDSDRLQDLARSQVRNGWARPVSGRYHVRLDHHEKMPGPALCLWPNKSSAKARNSCSAGAYHENGLMFNALICQALLAFAQLLGGLAWQTRHKLVAPLDEVLLSTGDIDPIIDEADLVTS